jgi:hypothetical protein
MIVKSRVKKVCALCGSEDISREAVVRWSVAAQDWEVTCIFDDVDCDECGETGEKEVELT